MGRGCGARRSSARWVVGRMAGGGVTCGGEAGFTTAVTLTIMVIGTLVDALDTAAFQMRTTHCATDILNVGCRAHCMIQRRAHGVIADSVIAQRVAADRGHDDAVRVGASPWPCTGRTPRSSTGRRAAPTVCRRGRGRRRGWSCGCAGRAACAEGDGLAAQHACGGGGVLLLPPLLWLTLRLEASARCDPGRHPPAPPLG